MAAQPPARRQIYTIACRCGALAAVHVSTFGRLQVCRSCRLPFTVAWRRDPKTQTLSPIVLAQARTRPAPAASRPAADGNPAQPRMHLSCGCGYRRSVRPDEASRNTRCPGCGKWMIVEKAPARPARAARPMPAAPPAPLAPPPAPPPPASPPADDSLVECPCGQRVRVRPELVGREAVCETCGRRLRVKSQRDPQTLVSRVRLVAASEPASGPAAALERAEGPSGGAPACACGQPLALNLLHAGSDFTCPACGRSMKLQKARDPQTLLTVIRPVFVPRAPQDAAPPAHPTPPEPAPAAEEESASFLADPADGDDASFPEAVPGPTQELFCRCGQEIVVAAADAGHPVQCPSCSVVLEVRQARDPQSGAAVLRVEVLGTLDENWKLEDFA